MGEEKRKKKKLTEASRVVPKKATTKVAAKKQDTSQVDAYAQYMNERRRENERGSTADLYTRGHYSSSIGLPVPIEAAQKSPGQVPPTVFGTDPRPDLGTVVNTYPDQHHTYSRPVWLQDYYAQAQYNDPSGYAVQKNMEAQSPAAKEANRQKILAERKVEAERKSKLGAKDAQRKNLREKTQAESAPPSTADTLRQASQQGLGVDLLQWGSTSLQLPSTVLQNIMSNPDVNALERAGWNPFAIPAPKQGGM